jgi:hypothetical protein
MENSSHASDTNADEDPPIVTDGIGGSDVIDPNTVPLTESQRRSLGDKGKSPLCLQVRLVQLMQQWE